MGNQLTQGDLLLRSSSSIVVLKAKQYLVTKLDLGKHVAHTRPVKVNYYTAAHNNVDVNVTKRLEVSEDNHAHT